MATLRLFFNGYSNGIQHPASTAHQFLSENTTFFPET